MRNLIKIVLIISIYLFTIFSSNLYSFNNNFQDNIDTFSGYLRINQKYVSIPGPNGMNIDLIHSYTGSRVLADDISSGYGWHLNNMQIIINAEYIKKKKKSVVSRLAFWRKSKKKSYGFKPKSAKLILLNGKVKDFVITQYINRDNHRNGFHYESWPLEMKSNDNWLIKNPENSHEMYLYDPNGKKYTFSVDVSNSSFNLGARLIKIEDLNGNWIQYDYEKIAPKKYPNLIKSYLKNITSNDGREINFYHKDLHVGKGAPHFIVLDKIITHTREWNFKYQNLKFKHSSNKVPVLSEVVYPDGSNWKYIYNQSTSNSRLLTEIKAPTELIIRYDYRYYKRDKKDFEQIAAKYKFDPNHNILGAIHYHINKEPVRCPEKNSKIKCIKNYIESDIGRKDYVYANNFLVKKKITDYKLNKVLQTNLYHYDFTKHVLNKKIINRDNTNYITQYLEHDNFGRARKIIEEGPSGRREKFYEYKDYEDSHIFNLLTNYKNGESFKKYNYNSKGQLINKNINNINFYYQYHSSGDIASITDSKEYETIYSNYFRGNPSKINYADGTEEKKEYDYYGLMTSHTNARGFKTEYQYDSLGRKIKVILPKGANEEISYYPNYVIKQKANYKEIIEYDYLNNLKFISKYDQGDLVTKKKFKFDFVGRKIFESKEFNNSYGNHNDGRYTNYDALNRIIEVDNVSKNENLVFKYNYLSNNGVEIVNPKGYKNITYYQAFGQSKYNNPIKLINANGIHTYVNRSQDGLINEIKRKDISRKYYYNNKRLIERYSDPETGRIAFQYNANGKLIETWSDHGDIRMIHYDKRNRLIMTHYNRLTRSDYYCYDEVGNLIRSRTNDSEWLYQYDANNNLIEASFGYKNQIQKYIFKYEYNDLNNLESIIYPSSKKINYNPNILGKPRQVGEYLNSIYYYPNKKVKSFSYHNGVLYNSELNQRGDIREINYNANDLININYDYDLLNNIIKIEDNIKGIVFFEYDNANRVINRHDFNNSTDIKYDEYDNILEKLSNKNEIYRYDSNNRLIKHRVGDKTYEYKYDKAGRVISDGIHEYKYNAKNQIRSIDSNLYFYDANKHKLSDGKNKYIHDLTGRKLVEIDKQGKYKEYYYLNNYIVAKTEYNEDLQKNTYYHFDKFNSFIASSDEYGNLNSDIQRDKGKLFSNSLFKEDFDDAFDYNGRMFNSNNNRFLSTELFNPKDLFVFNRYMI